MKKLWRKFVDWLLRARTMRIINAWMTLLWIIMIPTAIFFGWIISVAFVSALSLWALVAAHLSAYQAARVEENQDNDANIQEVLDLVKKLYKELEDKGVLDEKE